MVLTAALTACSSHQHSEADHEEGEHHHHHDDSEIVVKPEDALRFGVETEGVVPMQFNEVVKTVGEILPVSTDQAVVTAPTSGVVRLTKGTTQGSKVNAGATIASISAKGITGGDSNEAAKVALEAAKRELDRVTPLLDEGIVTKKTYNDALQAYDAAKAAYSGTAALGIATSPIAGVIGSVTVADGAYVEAGQPIATVAKSTRLTLKAMLPQRYVSFLPLVETANIFDTQTGRLLSLAEHGGKLLSSAVASGNDTPGYVPVYFTFDNSGDVVPGSAVEVYLIGSAKAEALTVPVSALTEQMGEKFVYIKKDEHGYEKVPVKTGGNDGKRVEIVNGVAKGDSVVVKGVTFVKLAETSTVVPEGHSHSH